MARRAATFNVRSRNGYAHFDATIGGNRFREALEDETGAGIPYPAVGASRDQTRAAESAAQKRYAEIIAGRSVRPTERVLTSMRLDEICAVWLDATETPRNGKSIKTKMGYVRHWIGFAADEARLADGRPRWPTDGRTPLERLVADGSPDDYGIMRLSGALRVTVRKEITALFEFLNWALRRKHLAAIPDRHPLPKGEPGKRTGPQRSKPVHIDPIEARKIIDALPEWSDGIKSKRKDFRARAYRVRDVFDFMWETTLRPSTIARLEVPRNWSPGRATLTLEDSDDKALYGRDVTLSARARTVLERVAPKAGSIFGDHDYRDYIKAAALKALPKDKALTFARYDFRHGRINNLLEVTNNLLGTAYLAGHKQLTTTNAYLRPQKRQGDDVISAMDAQPEPSGPEKAGTIPSRDGKAPQPSPKTDGSSSTSSRGEWIRTTDPQTPRNGSGKQPAGIPADSADGASVAHARNADDPLDRDGIPSPFGHAPPAVVDAQRALLVEAAVWASFDAFELACSDEDQ
jgi:hypothetical protein